jgi:hypothetical protein
MGWQPQCSSMKSRQTGWCGAALRTQVFLDHG